MKNPFDSLEAIRIPNLQLVLPVLEGDEVTFKLYESMSEWDDGGLWERYKKESKEYISQQIKRFERSHKVRLKKLKKKKNKKRGFVCQT